MDKTLRLVRISHLISAIQRVWRFFSGNLFYKSNGKLFSCVCIAWYKHSRHWENSPQLCKPLTSPQVCITVSNSPNPSRVYIRLCKHGKRFLLLKSNIAIACITTLWYFTFPSRFQSASCPVHAQIFLEKHLVEELLILLAQDLTWIPPLNFLAKPMVSKWDSWIKKII